jgi:hypothetical protein
MQAGCARAEGRFSATKYLAAAPKNLTGTRENLVSGRENLVAVGENPESPTLHPGIVAEYPAWKAEHPDCGRAAEQRGTKKPPRKLAAGRRKPALADCVGNLTAALSRWTVEIAPGGMNFTRSYLWIDPAEGNSKARAEVRAFCQIMSAPHATKCGALAPPGRAQTSCLQYFQSPPLPLSEPWAKDLPAMIH